MAAEDLVRDRRSFGGGLGAADLGSCRFQKHRFVEASGLSNLEVC